MLYFSAKGRTNTELREQFFLPEGASQSRMSFTSTPRRKSTQSGASTPTGASTPMTNGNSSRNASQQNSPSSKYTVSISSQRNVNYMY